MDNVVYGQLLYFNLGSFKLIQSTIQPKTPIGFEYTITRMAWHDYFELTDPRQRQREATFMLEHVGRIFKGCIESQLSISRLQAGCLDNTLGRPYKRFERWKHSSIERTSWSGGCGFESLSAGFFFFFIVLSFICRASLIRSLEDVHLYLWCEKLS